MNLANLAIVIGIITAELLREIPTCRVEISRQNGTVLFTVRNAAANRAYGLSHAITMIEIDSFTYPEDFARYTAKYIAADFKRLGT